MKLFWKLFCSMVAVTVLACSLGGWLLVDAQFRTSLNREVTAAYDENDLLRYTLAREIQSNPAMDREGLTRIVSGITITTSDGPVAFRISDSTGETIAVRGTVPVDAAPLTLQLSQNQRGWRLTSGERPYLHAASPLVLDGGADTLYLENCREVTDVFQAREEQYRRFTVMMLALTVLVGTLSLGVSGWILRPLRQLSGAAAKMSAGELSVRVTVSGRDELGQLSADFNAMASQLETQVQELKDAARRQEEFIASFAHELKTPLTSIIGYADLLRSRPATEAQVRESAGYIFSEGRRLDALSRKLLELVVLNRQDFPRQSVSMDAFLRRAGGTLRPVLSDGGIRLVVRAQPGSVLLEPDLMETVLLNLLDNARKSIEADGVITLEGVVREDGGYRVQVTDNGKGIPAAELSRITEPFYMVDKSRARAQGGAGLGLALCRRIVELHGGTMSFQSTEGVGTCVTIGLPDGKEVL